MTTTTATDSVADSIVALRTIPVIVRKGATALRINAPLDDASSKSYINSDIVAQLGLEGSAEKLTVNVLDGNQAEIGSATVEIVMENIDKTVSRPGTAYMTNRVTGNMQVVKCE